MLCKVTTLVVAAKHKQRRRKIHFEREQIQNALYTADTNKLHLPGRTV